MKSPTMTFENRRIRSVLPSVAVGAAQIVWLLVRLPILAVLLVLEPLMSLVLTAVAVFGFAAAVILRLAENLSHFPFWGMVTFSGGSLLALTGYRALVGIFSR